MAFQCFECSAEIAVPDDELAEAFLAHARADHDWPYPDQAIRNYAEATLRLDGPTERLDEIGEVVVHAMTAERLDDWTEFFDHRAFAGNPECAGCYCFEPHSLDPESPPLPDDWPHWSVHREGMRGLLGDGRAQGYLAYVDGVAAGWVNASFRSAYALYKCVDPNGPPAGDVIGVSCFIVAPPYRRHGIAAALLDRVMEDAVERGASWVEGYPKKDPEETDTAHFRGPRSMFDARGFEEIEQKENYAVVRRPVE